jgi:hypothetical protein
MLKTNKNNLRYDVHTLQKNIDYKKIILVTAIFGGFSVFSTFSIVFRLKQPFHVDGKMKRLGIMQCMFNNKFVLGLSSFH